LAYILSKLVQFNPLISEKLGLIGGHEKRYGKICCIINISAVHCPIVVKFGSWCFIGLVIKAEND